MSISGEKKKRKRERTRGIFQVSGKLHCILFIYALYAPDRSVFQAPILVTFRCRTHTERIHPAGPYSDNYGDDT